MGVIVGVQDAPLPARAVGAPRARGGLAVFARRAGSDRPVGPDGMFALPRFDASCAATVPSELEKRCSPVTGAWIQC
jgi:hypothetical protein